MKLLWITIRQNEYDVLFLQSILGNVYAGMLKAFQFETDKKYIFLDNHYNGFQTIERKRFLPIILI